MEYKVWSTEELRITNNVNETDFSLSFQRTSGHMAPSEMGSRSVRHNTKHEYVWFNGDMF